MWKELSFADVQSCFYLVVMKLYKIPQIKTLSKLVIQKDAEGMATGYVVTSPVLTVQLGRHQKCEQSVSPLEAESSQNRPIQQTFEISFILFARIQST